MKANDREGILQLLRRAEGLLRSARELLGEESSDWPKEQAARMEERCRAEAPAADYTPIDVAFPVAVFFQSHHLGHEVAGKLYADGSIEIEGERYGTPSSNRLCDKYRHGRTNMWRVWKFKDRQGSQYIIDVLRVHKLVGPGYRENGKQFRRLIGK